MVPRNRTVGTTTACTTPVFLPRPLSGQSPRSLLSAIHHNTYLVLRTRFTVKNVGSSHTGCDDRAPQRIVFCFFSRTGRLDYKPSRNAVPFWGRSTQILSNLSPQRDCGPKKKGQELSPSEKKAIPSKEWVERERELSEYKADS